MNTLRHTVTQLQASESTKIHCLYGRLYLRIKPQTLAYIYGKGISTIYDWIRQWTSRGSLARLSGHVNHRKFNDEMRKFIINIFNKCPTMFLDEAREKFLKEYHKTISIPTIWRILDEANYSHQVIERRAIQISKSEIIRLTNELTSLPMGWIYENLVFLDEVGFDNRDMFRKRGYGLRGQRIIYRGEFTRKGHRCYPS